MKRVLKVPGDEQPTAKQASGRAMSWSRYLGQDETRWDCRFRHYLHDDPAHTGTVWLRLRPDSLVVQDLSYSA